MKKWFALVLILFVLLLFAFVLNIARGRDSMIFVLTNNTNIITGKVLFQSPDVCWSVSQLKPGQTFVVECSIPSEVNGNIKILCKDEEFNINDIYLVPGLGGKFWVELNNVSDKNLDVVYGKE